MHNISVITGIASAGQNSLLCYIFDISIFSLNIHKTRLTPLLAFFFVFTIPSGAHADKFTAADLLAWSEASQDSYFQTSVTMAAFVGSKNPGERAKCLGHWYLENAAMRAQRNAEIRSAMHKFPAYHPTGIILAMIEKACGSFAFQ